MTYPTGLLALTLEDIDRRAVDLKLFCQSLSSELGTIGASSTRILAAFIYLRETRKQLAALSAAPGLAAYAQAQKNDASLDVVAAFNGMLSALDNATNWIAANFPKDGSGFLLARTLGADGPVDRVFPVAQLGTFKAQIDAVVASIA